MLYGEELEARIALVPKVLITTSFSLARSKNACEEGVAALRVVVGPDVSDDEPINVRTILEGSRGWPDFWWVFKGATHQIEDEYRVQMRLFGAACALAVVKHFEKVFPDDKRVRESVQTSRNFWVGEATDRERESAESAAKSAAWSAWSAAWSAESAAKSAAEAAAEAAAWSAESAAWSAESAAESAAKSAAESAAESAQKELLQQFLL